MSAKSIGISILILLLILGLLQIDAIGNLNPIFHAIAASVGRMVDWVLAAYSPNTVILTGEPEFLNTEPVQDDFLIDVKKSTPPQYHTEDVPLETPANGEDSGWELSEGDFRDMPQTSPTEDLTSRSRQLLQEIVAPEDPVTNLFPETEWYDTVDWDRYDFAELLTTEETDEEIQSDEALDADVVQPLVDEVKSQIQQKLESDALR